MRVTVGLDWFWLGMAATVPPAAALIVSLPFWRRQGDSLLGSVIGSGVVFAAAVFFISREYFELDRLRASCVAANVPCFFKPADFIRYAIYSSIAFGEVMAIFAVGLSMEERARRRTRAPEWR